jgi:hypothetical protein
MRAKTLNPEPFEVAPNPKIREAPKQAARSVDCKDPSPPFTGLSLRCGSAEQGRDPRRNILRTLDLLGAIEVVALPWILRHLLGNPSHSFTGWFRVADFVVPSAPAAAILFHSMKTTGELERNSLHTACPVIKGEKWSAAKWCAAFCRFYRLLHC